MVNPNTAPSSAIEDLIEEAKQNVLIASKSEQWDEVAFWEDRRLRLLAQLEEAYQRERLEAKKAG